MISNLDEDFISSVVQKYGTDIRKINLSNNGLRCLDSITLLKESLEKVDLSCNDISDLTPLGTLSLIKEIYLSENNISDTLPLALLSDLRILDLRGNKISSMENFRQLRGKLSSLQHLLLEGNPVCISAGYPSELFEIFPSLDTVDNWDVSSFSRSRAAAAAAATAATAVPTMTFPQLDNSARSNKTQSLPLSNKEAGHSAARVEHTLEEKDGGDDNGNDNDEDEKGALSAREASLKLQLAALEDAFALQERILAENGREAALKASSAGAAAAVGSVATEKPLFVSSTNGNGIAGSGVDECSIECFPYLKLLQLWRRQAQRSTIERLQAERSLQHAMSRLKKQRNQIHSLASAGDASALSYKERFVALAQRAEALASALQEAEGNLSAENKKRLVLERQNADYCDSLHRVRATLMHYKTEMSGGMLNANAVTVQAVQKIQDMERRLSRATERVSFAAAVVAQKELSLRNSAATLEAERRMLAISVANMKAAEASSSASARKEVSGAVADSGNSNSNSGGGYADSSSKRKYLSDLQLQPEAESLLRSLFRTLDPEDTGTTPVALLADCLGIALESSPHECQFPPQSSSSLPRPLLQSQSEEEGEEEVGEEEEDDDDNDNDGDQSGSGTDDDDDDDVAEEEDEEKSQQENPSMSRRHVDEDIDADINSLRSLVKAALGKYAWRRLKEGLKDTWLTAQNEVSLPSVSEGGILVQGGGEGKSQSVQQSVAGPTITWGEFLLLLIPDPSKDGGRGSYRHSNDRSGSPLTPTEFHALRSAGLLGDLGWGVIPLDMAKERHATSNKTASGNVPRANRRSVSATGRSYNDASFGSNTSNSSSSTSANDAEKQELTEEVRRLARERSFLLKRLQDSNKELLRRAEGIRAFFESDLRKSKLREERFRSQISELTATKAVYEKKLKDLESSSSAHIDKLRNKRQELEDENEKLKVSLAARRSEEITRLETEAESERAKCSRVEVEHNLLQRESAKKEVRIRGLQRDMMRLQSALSAANTEVSKLRDREKELLLLSTTATAAGAPTSSSSSPSSSSGSSGSSDPEKESLVQENERLRQRISLLESSLLVDDKQAPLTAAAGRASSVDAVYQQQQGNGPVGLVEEDKENSFRKVREYMATAKAAVLSSLAPGAANTAAGLSNTLPSSSLSSTSAGAPAAVSDEPGRQDRATTATAAAATAVAQESSGIPRSGYGPDIYAAQLTKLLRLAEEAIGKG